MTSRRRIGLVAVGALLLPLLLPLAAEAATQDYGSIAYSPSKKVAAAGFAGSQPAAATAAVQQCRDKGGASDCWAVIWFRDAVGALARASNPAGDPYYAAGYGFASNVKDATAFADKYAKEGCQQRGGKDCEVIFRAQTPTVSSHGTGGTLTQPKPAPNQQIQPKPAPNQQILPPQGLKQLADQITNVLLPILQSGGPGHLPTADQIQERLDALGPLPDFVVEQLLDRLGGLEVGLSVPTFGLCLALPVGSVEQNKCLQRAGFPASASHPMQA